VRRVDALLEARMGTAHQRRARFEELAKKFAHDRYPFRPQMAAVMQSFQPGLFAAAGAADLPADNLDLERWFRHPKGHERRIHGRAHAGVRLVQEGPTLLPALDAHLLHPQPFASVDLCPYVKAQLPACQCLAIGRRKLMRRARSKKLRPLLLATLERRYLDSS
jgi:hypothetical protein